ncbi:MAG: ABC transporter permease [Thermoplasmatales archaeon]|nr:MAG: ABC transporter permease [Thermoplasmatales archaeon]
MNAGIIWASFKADLQSFYRSKATLFWTLLFPILLILMFGAIFSGVGDAEYELVVVDYDDSDMSVMFTEILNDTDIIKTNVKVIEEENILSYIKNNDIKRLIVIPDDFEQSLNTFYFDENVTTSIKFYFDQSEQQTNSIIRSVISAVVIELNKNISGGKDIILIDDIETISGEFEFIDFFLPGMIGFTIMQTCIYGSLERNTKFRKDGILRKLLTTPITRTEWILSKMLFQLFLSFVSAFLIIVIGIFLFGLNIHISLLMFILIIATSFLFTGMGMVIGRFVKDEESAGMAGGAVTFPMMFLAGTFFPLEQMPEFLQTIAKVLPLYYVNEGFRNAMIYLKTDDAIFHSVIVLIFAIIFFLTGLILTKWKED